jgi:AbrB family looped-hinge helix DNA binding protein
MQEFETRLTEKGQVTIPLEIRRLLGLQPHDMIRFEVVGEEVRIKRATSKLLAGFGAVTPKLRPEDFRSIREKVEKEIAEDVVSEA